MDDVIFYFFVADDKTLFICLILIFALMLTAGVFSVISHINKKSELKLLGVAYTLLYDLTAFTLPLIFRWWLAAILTVVLILLIHKYYEKQSVVSHYKKIGKEDYTKTNLTELPVVFSTAFVAFLMGFAVFFGITEL